MRIVKLLDAAAAGDIVLRNGHLQFAVVVEVARLLHQPLTVGALAHHHRAIKVLQRPANDLTCAGTLPIHQHHQGNARVHGFAQRLVGLVPFGDLAAGLHHQFVLRHEEVHDVHRFAEQTTAVAAQVQHHLGGALFLQLLHCGAYLLTGRLRETVQLDVAHLVHRVDHPLIRHIGDLDLFTGE